MKEARILIADDHEMVRKGLRVTLEAEPGWSVVAEAANGRQAVELATSLQPDVVVMDIGMPELNGLEATREIRDALPKVRVLVLTVYEAEHVVNEVIQAGAQGYLLKSDAGRELVQAIGNLLQGKSYFTARIAGMILVGNPHEDGQSVGAASRLSHRERAVVQLVAEGRNCTEIAAVLRISPRTAMKHRTHTMQKVGARSIAELVRYAVRNDIIQP